ncbi:alkaline phosphatase family protein [Arenibacter amylolyticus]|uniref:alkaline phosphatase family protein n=1 Tax=Arenibacter amylolyticus TaxID=1406873 RepID=UPI000A3C2BF0|nr:alkaline phosphatase family protein [Arenibacter amylolyticus]
MQKVILLGLNELNFSYIKHYISEGYLENFKYLFDNWGYSETTSEDQYQLLEPWIQWVTVSTGKTYEEHQVFRLGDMVYRQDLPQIFEQIEENGYSVGAVSPFNVDNRLKNPHFFAPDPWTQTKAAGNKTFTELSDAVSQAVNDNANGKLTIKSIKALIKGLGKYTSIADYKWYMGKLAKIKSETGVKALILDKLLADAFLNEWNKSQPDFSNLFLNSGAHFQHHYMFNSRAYKGDLKNPEWYCPQSQDPLFEILKVYDEILGRLLKLNVRLVIGTGLHQQPHKHLTYYWRLKEHADFLKLIGVNNYSKVIPRMSRDFLIEFSSENDATEAEKLLDSYKASSDGKTIFNIDNRGTSLFVELVYPNDIDENFAIEGKIKVDNFKKYIAFVAIKNGEHNGIGYVVDTENRVPKSRFPLKDVYNYLLEDFKAKKNSWAS